MTKLWHLVLKSMEAHTGAHQRGLVLPSTWGSHHNGISRKFQFVVLTSKLHHINQSSGIRQNKVLFAYPLLALKCVLSLKVGFSRYIFLH